MDDQYRSVIESQAAYSMWRHNLYVNARTVTYQDIDRAVEDGLISMSMDLDDCIEVLRGSRK